MKKIKYFGYFIFSLIWFLTIIFVFLFITEFTQGFSFLDKKSNEHNLHNTKYYGKKLKINPYKSFDTKYLHPYLIWSMPWKKKEISKINNEFVSIDKNGYRINPYQNDKIDKALLLGGSTAFGYYSSSNFKTPAALLTKNSNFSFINLNGPSWNSHQELVALIKYNKKYKLSLSLTGNNDIQIFCQYTLETELGNLYPDSIERFEELNNVLNKITQQFLNIGTLDLIKHFILRVFPHSTNLYFKFKRIIKNDKKNVPTQTVSNNKCYDKNEIYFDKVDIIIDRFLDNQKVMRAVSESRNANHYLFLQPIFSFNVNEKSKRNELFSYAFDKIMDSDYCKKNCFNLVSVFKDQKYKTESFYNNLLKKYNSEIFIDNVHLSDRGVEIIAPIIASKIN